LMIARRLFSYKGGDVQGKILELLLAKIKWNGQGKALDIGCGSGALTIALAKRFRNARVTGVDYWGGAWSYSQKQCEANATLEGVGNRVGFSQASAARLPFADESFDLAVSNLTFHEVKGDKLDVLREALRVVKKGGRFAFQDLFLLKAYYGKQEELIAAVQAMGIRQVHFADTSKAAFIPRILKLPFMVGTIGVLYGTK
jgi:ubiquinone/menaquinone biosynthesis C-methylase UbiE